MDNIILNERLFTTLLNRRVTEKGTALEGSRKYVFRVKKEATKLDVKQAVESMLGVGVVAVNICNMKGKVKQSGKKVSKRKDWKKAYVTLKEGKEIQIS